MIWIDYILLAFLAVTIFVIGFFCGYVKDKKEVSEYFEESLKLNNEAEERLNKAKALLDNAHDYYEETHEELERLKEEWGLSLTEGEDEGSGGV